ncbi:translation initiation factor IF-2 [Gloeothece citriformis PCC 7424]|uniref:Translation initiation factor IF-2 n=1 Tax=Gloeothece citriformis (strain PCC 7424) TaxID=65393 RepID=IF2_GLOC7|nr:translation initiation factor IF-2 [Gloeothece citriformis]B7KIU2.1 RecName: Full=Translation initiation factor IF-2 [Gloeothece citriformis PCC 7424]ACK70778.1 translation initiation factor IF-2 [Gloeothece citriformis PCC 7424]
MSNSKVRIYELSKELNLDNKDILEICDQLNIAVKSHSSTITESQAERIKAKAEKLNHQMAGKIHSGSGIDRGQNLAKERKQEILAIHHKPNRPFSSTDAPVGSGQSSPLIEPPRPPMKPQPPSPSRSEVTSPITDEPVSTQEDTNGSSSSHEREPQSPMSPFDQQQPEQNTTDHNQEQQNQLKYNQEQSNQLEQESAISSELSEVNVSKLLRPPVRPSEKPASVPSPSKEKEAKSNEPTKAQPIISPKENKSHSKENKLKLPSDIKPKPNKDKDRDGKKPDKEKDKKSLSPQPKVKRESREQREPRESREQREPRESREQREPRESREQREPKLSTELKRPTPPKPPQKPKQAEVAALAIEPEDVEDTAEDLLEEDPLEALTQKPKLKRPTPPKVGKRQNWDEEEEETEEGKGKAGKAAKAGKNKRRQLLLEDEDDFDSDLEEILEIPTAVSISTARPPKPKSMKPAASGNGASKNVKAPTKAEPGRGKSAERERSERKDRKEQPQRAETLVLDKTMTVRELAERLGIAETEIIRILFFKGIAVNITQTLDFDTIQAIAEELEVQIESPEVKAAATKTTEMLDANDLENLHRRPPVVTIMGHVDHGKTTLLDSIRKTKVAQGEAGGITQHIGAYHVDIEHEGKQEQIVFLDTPGHEAFTAMRARGARVTDIAILVVAADDGVQPQTREAISHARAAEVPIVVAINKIDKPESNPDRIKQELSELSLVPEEWGGETIMVPVSALKGENLDTLLEMLLLVAEVGELSANPDRLARGTVIEANLDRTRGPVATLLVQNGTLRVGDTIVAGPVLGKIRAMIDDRGNKVEEASPSFAVEILGLNEVPAAGDEFEVFENEKEARALADQRSQDLRQTRLQQAMSSRRISLSTLSAQAQEGKLKELNLILKADVQGSVEAILGSLKQLPQNEVQIRVLLAAPGEITETDVDLAAASGAVIVGFNTTLASGARQSADQEGIDIREYNIIYKLLDDIQGAMEGLLDPEEVESPLGVAEVRAVFPVGRGAVAGCYVQSGKIIRNRQLRVRRKGEVIYEGVLDSLKRMKEDAREVNAGYECGIGVSKFNDWQEGDSIEVFEMVMKRRTLSTK